jgi:hypothetical protein
MRPLPLAAAPNRTPAPAERPHTNTPGEPRTANRDPPDCSRPRPEGTDPTGARDRRRLYLSVSATNSSARSPVTRNTTRLATDTA